MKIIRPLTFTAVSPAAKTSTNVTSPETGTTAYASGTTYALNDKVQVGSDTSTVTITVGTPAVVTWTAHEFVVGDKVAFTTTGALPYGMTASKLYFVTKILTVDTFEFSPVEGGTAQTTSNFFPQSGTHTGTVYIYQIYKSLQASNTGHNPRKASNVAWWQAIKSSNHHAMFDGTVTSQTISETIDVTLTVSTAVDTIVLLNISGYYCTVTCTDTTLGVVYNVVHTITTLVNTIYEDTPELVITGIPTFNSGTIRIHMMNGLARMCAIGACLVGYAADAGGTEYGADVGIQDFSVIEQNDFGDYDITPRTYSKTGSFQVMVPLASVPYIYQMLVKRRSIKTLYIGSDSYTPTAIYGFPDDWRIIIQYQNYSILNIDIKGLT